MKRDQKRDIRVRKTDKECKNHTHQGSGLNHSNTTNQCDSTEPTVVEPIFSPSFSLSFAESRKKCIVARYHVKHEHISSVPTTNTVL